MELFSDLKRHNLGEELADPFPNPHDIEPALFRTPPLWGLADTAPYLHDGRALTVTDAIEAHGGDASHSRELFRTLPENESCTEIILASLARAQTKGFAMNVNTKTAFIAFLLCASGCDDNTTRPPVPAVSEKHVPLNHSHAKFKKTRQMRLLKLSNETLSVGSFVFSSNAWSSSQDHKNSTDRNTCWFMVTRRPICNWRTTL